MEYELAKKLKDSGFPQNTERWWGYHGDTLMEMPGKDHWPEKDNGGNVPLASPSLEELITECVKLSVQGDFHLEKNPEVELWGASIDCFKDDPYINGKTAIEAVANLYLHLSLHKKV